jgi:hypothetical protein
MMLLQLGTDSKAVHELRGLMRRAGYPLPDTPLFDVELDHCVRAYQEDRGLAVDGVVVHRGGKTWPRLAVEQVVELRPDQSPRAVRLSLGLACLYDAHNRRMTPQYRRSRIDAWERMEAGKEHAYVVPLSSDGSGRYGATCGHAAWLLTSWWMRGMHPDKGIYPTWRTGRGPTSSMPNRILPLCSVLGEVIRGKLCRGLKEYTASVRNVSELADLSRPEHVCQWYLCQRRSGHVICILRIGPNMGCIDPRTGLPAVLGLYRLAADGSKATLGRPWTWRRVRPGEKGPWTCYGMADIPESGEIAWGPLSGAPDLPLVLEG